MEKKVVRALVLHRKDGAYGYTEYEILEDVLKKQGKVVTKTEPDIFAVFMSQLTRAARTILGI